MNNYINIFLEFLYLLCNAFLLFRICEENMHNKISIPMKLFYIIVFVVFPATIHAIGILSYFAPILFMLIIFRKLNKLLLKCLFNYIAILFLFIPIATIQTLLLNDAHFALSSQEYLNYNTCKSCLKACDMRSTLRIVYIITKTKYIFMELACILESHLNLYILTLSCKVNDIMQLFYIFI